MNYNSNKTLIGSELPSDWPIITPDEEYRKRFEGFTPGVDLPIEHFSLQLQQGPKELRYLAVEHSNDPQNGQFLRLEQNFRQMVPQVVLHEGPPSDASFPNKDAAMKYGEVAFMQFLVQEHNDSLKPGEKPIVFESTDMPDSQWINAFQRINAFQEKHTNEEIAVYDVLRKVNVVAEQIRRDRNLSVEQKRIKLGELNTRINNDFRGYLVEKGFPDLFGQLQRDGEKEWNQDLICDEVKKQTGQELSVDINQLNVRKFKKMFDEETEFRDKYVVEKIADKVRQNDKVMAVMGSSHVLREEASLREFFGTK